MQLTGNRVATTVVIPTAVIPEPRAALAAASTERNAVIYFHDGDRAVIAASNAGAPHHPDWYYNVLADPQVSLGGTPVRARVIEDRNERERLWSLADRVFPAFAVYRRNAAGWLGGRSLSYALTPT